MGLISPAAFVAVGAGTALLLVADALHPWMFLKLLAVGVLVIAHVRLGQLLARLADPSNQPHRGRAALIQTAVAGAVLAILWLVLAKPDVPVAGLPDWLTRPGLLDRPPPRS
jgi:protoporphyrinogen IX oxidase